MSLWVILVVAAVGTIVMLAMAAWLPESTRNITRFFVRQDNTWATMQERGTWRVGMDPSFPPFESLNDDGEPVGYDVDLVNAMAEAWGLEAEIIAIGFDSLPDALLAGRVDSVVSALPYDPRSTQDYAYSRPYFEAGVRLAVRQESAIESVDELGGHRVAVEWGSMGDMVGRRLQRQEIPVELVPFSTPAEAVEALVQDETIDALLIDNVTLREHQGQGAPVVAVGPALESNPYVIAMPLNAQDLQAQVETLLAEWQETGVLAEIEARWFGPLPAGS